MWRYGAFGMIGQGAMTPLLGLVIILWAAVDLQQGWLRHPAGLVGPPLLSVAAHRNARQLGAGRIESGPDTVVAGERRLGAGV
jgi:hypothetical protein